VAVVHARHPQDFVGPATIHLGFQTAIGHRRTTLHQWVEAAVDLVGVQAASAPGTGDAPGGIAARDASPTWRAPLTSFAWAVLALGAMAAVGKNVAIGRLARAKISDTAGAVDAGRAGRSGSAPIGTSTDATSSTARGDSATTAGATSRTRQRVRLACAIDRGLASSFPASADRQEKPKQNTRYSHGLHCRTVTSCRRNVHAESGKQTTWRPSRRR